MTRSLAYGTLFLVLVWLGAGSVLSSLALRTYAFFSAGINEHFFFKVLSVLVPLGLLFWAKAINIATEFIYGQTKSQFFFDIVIAILWSRVLVVLFRESLIFFHPTDMIVYFTITALFIIKHKHLLMLWMRSSKN